MTETQQAYSTSDPGTVSAFLAAIEAQGKFRDKILDDMAEMGLGSEVRVMRGMWGSADKLIALGEHGDVVPEGWRKVRGRLEPRRGKPGDKARQWLADHQPIDVRKVMVEHGLPRAVAIPGGMGYRMIEPVLFHHDGELWALFEAEPGKSDLGLDKEECTWTPRKLSEFYAAREQMEEAHPK